MDVGANANALLCYVIGRWQWLGKRLLHEIRRHSGLSNGLSFSKTIGMQITGASP